MALNSTIIKIIIVVFVAALAIVLAFVFFNQEPEEELPYTVEYKDKLGHLIIRQEEELPSDWWWGNVYYEDPVTGENKEVVEQEYVSVGWGRTSFRIISDRLVDLDDRTYTVELYNFEIPDPFYYTFVVESS